MDILSSYSNAEKDTSFLGYDARVDWFRISLLSQSSGFECLKSLSMDHWGPEDEDSRILKRREDSVAFYETGNDFRTKKIVKPVYFVQIWLQSKPLNLRWWQSYGNRLTLRKLNRALLPLQMCSSECCRVQLKCDGTRAETRFRLSAKRKSPF